MSPRNLEISLQLMIFLLKLEKGKMLGFLGRNGAGKTTTFRMILGLSETTEGTITYEGKNR